MGLAKPDWDSDLRRQRRHGVAMPAHVKYRGKWLPEGKITDISAVGCRIAGSAYLEVGNQIWIRVGPLEGQRATVMWAEDGNAGCSFHRPLYEPLLIHLAKAYRYVPVDGYRMLDGRAVTPPRYFDGSEIIFGLASISSLNEQGGDNKGRAKAREPRPNIRRVGW